MEELKKFIASTYEEYDCGLFYNRNTVGDNLSVIYEDNKGRRVEGCEEYSYYEVFGLTQEEQDELTKYYNDIRGCNDFGFTPAEMIELQVAMANGSL